MNNDLISRSALMKRLKGVLAMVEEEPNQTYANAIRHTMIYVKLSHAVDAEVVRHERMTNPTFKGVKPVCTGCHIAYDKDPYWNYCPYCGAKMDAEV